MRRKLRKTNKKGVTPIIAIILLMMMTVAAAGAAFFWILRVQSSFTGSSEQHAESLNEHVNSQILVNHIEYTPDGTTYGNLTMVLANVGAQPIPLDNSASSPTTTLILKNNDQRIICSPANVNAAPAECISGCGSGTTLDAGSSATVKIKLSSDCLIASDTTYPNGTLFYANLDFSGQVGTQASFTK